MDCFAYNWNPEILLDGFRLIVNIHLFISSYQWLHSFIHYGNLYSASSAHYAEAHLNPFRLAHLNTLP